MRKTVFTTPVLNIVSPGMNIFPTWLDLVVRLRRALEHHPAHPLPPLFSSISSSPPPDSDLIGSLLIDRVGELAGAEGVGVWKNSRVFGKYTCVKKKLLKYRVAWRSRGRGVGRRLKEKKIFLLVLLGMEIVCSHIVAAPERRRTRWGSGRACRPVLIKIK